MTEQWKTRNKGKTRKIIVLKCDTCGKENRIRELNVNRKEIEAINNNDGCYCSKCRPMDRKGFTYSILAGEFFTVYPNVISLKEFQERQEGVNRAKEILKRGIQQIEIKSENNDKSK